MSAMGPLEQKIVARIRAEGPITFAAFMEMSLYDPEFGYYTAGRFPIGREGDFYTSSHLHPVFGKTVGTQIEEMWRTMGEPARFTVVEMGAGAGYLAHDMLGYLAERDISRALDYRIIERSRSVEERQRSLLAEVTPAVSWHRSLRDAGTFSGCVLTNELLDAFPVHVVVTEDGLREIYVTVEGGQLRQEPGPLSSPELAHYFSDLEVQLPERYTTEVNLGIKEWLSDVDAVLTEGFVLTIDYGYTSREYFSEDRNRGTLMCYYRHTLSEDPLAHVGEQDITAHVNFSAVRRWGEERGLTALGYTSQGAFLMSLGIDADIERIAAGPPDGIFELARIKNLILPQGMGESHMVLIQYRGEGAPRLSGFAMRNRLRFL